MILTSNLSLNIKILLLGVIYLLYALWSSWNCCWSNCLGKHCKRISILRGRKFLPACNV